MTIKWKANDGGRKRSGRSSKGNDCVVRSLSIATGLDYKEVEKLARYHARNGKAGNGSISQGMFNADVKNLLKYLGWELVSAPKFEGSKARPSDIARIESLAILNMAKHISVIKDGVLHDVWDCRDKMVYNYWKKQVRG